MRSIRMYQVITKHKHTPTDTTEDRDRDFVPTLLFYDWSIVLEECADWSICFEGIILSGRFILTEGPDWASMFLEYFE